MPGGGPASLLDELSSHELRAVLPRMHGELGVRPPTGLEEELVAVDEEARHPGRWLSYTPADACPDNNVYRDGRLRLLYFGFGGLRHLALDAAYSVIPFPTCWCYAPISHQLSDQMLSAFRESVAAALPEVLDDELWEHKVAWACAMWFVGFIAGIAAHELDRAKQRGPLTGREAAVAQPQTVARRCHQYFPAVAKLAGTLGDRLQERWGTDMATAFPALASSLE